MKSKDIPCGNKECRFYSKTAKRGNCITKYRFEHCEQYRKDPTEKAIQIQDGGGTVAPKNGR